MDLEEDAYEKHQVAGGSLETFCYIPQCTNVGDIPVKVANSIYWPSGAVLGVYLTKVMLCEHHVEQLAQKRSIDA